MRAGLDFTTSLHFPHGSLSFGVSSSASSSVLGTTSAVTASTASACSVVGLGLFSSSAM